MADSMIQDSPPFGSASAILEALAAKQQAKATGERLQSERLKLFRDNLEAPLVVPRINWFASWRVIRVTSEAGDLDAVVVELIRAATAWRAAGRVCKAWIDAGNEWVAGAKSSCPHVHLCWPYHQPDDAVLVWWSAAVVKRHGLPIFAHLEVGGDECDFWVTVLQLIDDPTTTQDQFREFFQHHPVESLSSQAMTMAVAVLPPPDGVTLTAAERPTDDDGRVAIRLIHQLVTLFQDPGDYSATAREILGLNQPRAAPPAAPPDESESVRDPEPECLSTASTPAVNSRKKPRGRPKLTDKLTVYRYIHTDMLAHQKCRTVNAIADRLMKDERVRGGMSLPKFKDLIRAAIVYFKRNNDKFPLTPPGQKP